MSQRSVERLQNTQVFAKKRVAPGHNVQQLFAQTGIHLTEDALCERLVKDLSHEALQSLRITDLYFTHMGYNPVKVIYSELVNQGGECALLSLLLRVI